MDYLIYVGYFFVATVIVLLLMALAFKAFYKKVEKRGWLLVINKKNSIDVTENGGWVLPIIHSCERIDATQKTFSIDKRCTIDVNDGLLCKDNILADVKVFFYLYLNPEPSNVKKVLANLSVAQVNSEEYLFEYMKPKFSDALKTVARDFDYEDLYSSRVEFSDKVKALIGHELDGFTLLDVSIDDLDQSSLEFHREDNILHVEGREKIARRTSAKNIETNAVLQDERTEKKKKDVSSEAARLSLSREEADAIAKQDREVRIIRATEDALAKSAEEEQRLIAEKARIKTEESLGIENENKEREIRVAQIANERITEIENEKVQRVKQTEAVKTETEVAVQNMEKEKTVETQRKEVAEITSQRVQIERKTAKEEEETLDLRANSGAERDKLVMVKGAEAKAESDQVVRIKEAEASKSVAEHNAEIVTINANAKLLEDDKIAQGKIKLADGIRAEESAKGLAKVEVDAAEAKAIKVRGEAEAEVESLKAISLRKIGEAEAQNAEDMGLAEAKGVEATELAKATGSKANYEAMSSITEETREQERYKLDLENTRAIEVARINSNVEIAARSSEVLAEAMKKAKIDIIGGETQFFDKIMNAVVTGKSIDRKFDNSEVLNSAVKDYRSGEKDLSADIKEVLQNSEVSTGDVGKLAIANFLSTKEGQSVLGQLTGLLNSKN